MSTVQYVPYVVGGQTEEKANRRATDHNIWGQRRSGKIGQHPKALFLLAKLQHLGVAGDREETRPSKSGENRMHA